MTRILFPSELSIAAPYEYVHLAGRVISLGDEQVSIADAEASVTVALSAPTELQLGDLVEMKLRREPAGNWSGSTLARYPQRKTIRPTEFNRLSDKRRAENLRARSKIYSAIRHYFEQESFVEVETPTFVPSPGLDPHVHSLGSIRRGERIDHLITSPEFHMKRLVVGGMPRIFQLARCFRSEELGTHHEPEFTLLEWYRAFADVSSVMKDTENLVRAAYAACGPVPKEVDGPFETITVETAFLEFAGVRDVSTLSQEDPNKYFSTWVEHIEPALARLQQPVFITRFPIAMAALAQPCPDDERFAERFELYFGGIELCNGYGELTDPVVQRARFERELERRKTNAEPIYPLDERFLSALEEGLPPTAGNALGVDRLIALVTGAANIAETLAFSDAER